jgi:hypothetical protein
MRNPRTVQAPQLPVDDSPGTLSAASPGQGAAQFALSEDMSLISRTQSSPDINVVEFESRTERLLNQHRRLEVHSSTKGVGLAHPPYLCLYIC